MSNPAKQPVIPNSDLHISKASIVMVAALVVFSLLIVAYARVTENGVVKTGGEDLVQIGALAYTATEQGFELHGEQVLFEADETSYAQGAIRSLERMNGGPLPAHTSFNVLQMRGGLVFLERVETGDRISLDAFSRAKTQAFAAKLKSSSKLNSSGSGDETNGN